MRGRGTFELVQEIDSSVTDSGTFLKFDAIYRPHRGRAGQLGGVWDTRTRWYGELVPAGDFFAITYVEQSPVAG